MSRLFEYTKLNLERTSQNLITQDSEFVYTDNNGTVPANKNYSVYYLTDKRELYFTGLLTSNYVRQLTRKKNYTLYSQYSNIKGLKRENYPSNYSLKLKDDDYSAGLIQRYFVQKANDVNSKIHEISKEDFNKKIPELIKEARAGFLFSNFYWTFWSVIMSGTDIEFGYIEFGYARFQLY